MLHPENSVIISNMQNLKDFQIDFGSKLMNKKKL